MNEEIIIRKAEHEDLSLLEALYKEAFPDEDLFPLVTELLNDKQNTLNLTAIKDEKIVGHIAFTKCHSAQKDIPLALLGPVAVLPKYQKIGIGSRLINEGFNVLKDDYVVKVLTLGNPNYYGRFGFVEENDIQPAYPIPAEWKAAWQSLVLIESSVLPTGKLNVTKPWQRKELWS